MKSICAGDDADMVQMIVEVFHQKYLGRVPLNVAPELVIQRQFNAIYPNGDMDLVETAQRIKADEFRTSKLNHILSAINTATDEQVKFELNTPGRHTADSQLNAALHDFREQFTAISNQEQIFNPFYLPKAFEFYDENFFNFNGNVLDPWDSRSVFLVQVIGYIERHLPACYWQAFAQGIYYIVDEHEKLKRDFKFRHEYNSFMALRLDQVHVLGYSYAVRHLGALCAYIWPHMSESTNAGPPHRKFFPSFIANKTIRLRELIYAQVDRQRRPSLTADVKCNRDKYSCCNIC